MSLIGARFVEQEAVVEARIGQVDEGLHGDRGRSA